ARARGTTRRSRGRTPGRVLERARTVVGPTGGLRRRMGVRRRVTRMARPPHPRAGLTPLDSAHRSRGAATDGRVVRRPQLAAKAATPAAADRRCPLCRRPIAGADRRTVRDRARHSFGDDDTGNRGAAPTHGGSEMTTPSEQWIVSELRRATDRMPLPPESRWVRERRSTPRTSTVAVVAAAAILIVAFGMTIGALRVEPRLVPAAGPSAFDVAEDEAWKSARALIASDLVLLRPTWVPSEFRGSGTSACPLPS